MYNSVHIVHFWRDLSMDTKGWKGFWWLFQMSIRITSMTGWKNGLGPWQGKVGPDLLKQQAGVKGCGFHLNKKLALSLPRLLSPVIGSVCVMGAVTALGVKGAEKVAFQVRSGRQLLVAVWDDHLQSTVTIFFADWYPCCRVRAPWSGYKAWLLLGVCWSPDCLCDFFLLIESILGTIMPVYEKN